MSCSALAALWPCAPHFADLLTCVWQGRDADGNLELAELSFPSIAPDTAALTGTELTSTALTGAALASTVLTGTALTGTRSIAPPRSPASNEPGSWLSAPVPRAPHHARRTMSDGLSLTNLSLTDPRHDLFVRSV